MSANPDTYAPFLTRARDPALIRRRRRRDRLGALAVLGGTTLVLAALLAIPLFLTASLVSWTPLPAGAWAELGTLLAGTVKAAVCALLVALPLGIGSAIFSAELRVARISRLVQAVPRDPRSDSDGRARPGRVRDGVAVAQDERCDAACPDRRRAGAAARRGSERSVRRSGSGPAGCRCGCCPR